MNKQAPMPAGKVGFSQAISRPRGVPKMGPKTIRSLEIDRGAGGSGHTVMHRFVQPNEGPYHEAEGPHVFGADQGKELLAHIANHLGIKVSAAEDED